MNIELTRAIHKVIPEERLVIELHPVHSCIPAKEGKECGACAGAVYRKEREPELRHILLALAGIGRLNKQQEFESDDDGVTYMSLFCEDGLGGSGAWYDLTKSPYGQSAKVKRLLLTSLKS